MTTRRTTAMTLLLTAVTLATLLLALIGAGCGGTDDQQPAGDTAASQPAVPHTPPPDTFQRAIFDDAWVEADDAERNAIFAELADELHVQAVRMDLRWSRAEPTGPGVYDEEYLGRIRASVDAARQNGLFVMIDVFGVPQWASDTSWWEKPPKGIEPCYQSFYPVAEEHLADWEEFATYLGTSFKGSVAWWECWNEPNMWSYIYPQKTADDPQFAARQYVKLLEPFSRAIHQADPDALVLGGVTAPFGTDDEMRTSPQRFATQLRDLGGAEWWDGYSHHPYVPATGRPMPAPTDQPRFPEYTVTLGNLETLVAILPDERLYLTEYGYPTAVSRAWGFGYVDEATQAAYVTAAYQRAAEFEQVRMLAWFLWRDIDKGADRWENAFFGLVRPDGTRKPSWEAYAGLQ